MGLKIIILVLITILAFLAVDLKKISENKIKTSIICFILLLSFVFTVRDYFIEERKTEEKEIFSKKQHPQDSLLRISEQNKLYCHIDSLDQVHKIDSTKVVMLNMMVSSSYNAKNMGIGVSGGQIGDNNYNIVMKGS